MNRSWILIVGLAFGACGGAGEAEEPTQVPEEDSVAEAEPDTGEALIPEQAFDDVKRVFERKGTSVSRCHTEAIKSGEIGKTTKGVASITVTIGTSGKAKSVAVALTGFKSPSVKSCIEGRVRTWTFTEHLNRDLDYSYQYKLQEF